MKDPWFELRRYTQARIGQGRAGCATPTDAQLDFQLAHAMARDAVHQPWLISEFAGSLSALGHEPLVLTTQITSREQYLQRPDQGRRLDQTSRDILQSHAQTSTDIALIVSDGLSSTAVHRHGLELIQAVLNAYTNSSLSVGPICLAANARVALSDEIGALLGARLAVIIVGERPGLSAADSLGIYMTYAPSPDNTDAERNCLSNIRPPEGMSYQVAATKLAYLSQQALVRKCSGVALKDDMPSDLLETSVLTLTNKP